MLIPEYITSPEDFEPEIGGSLGDFLYVVRLNCSKLGFVGEFSSYRTRLPVWENIDYGRDLTPGTGAEDDRRWSGV